MMKKSKNYLKKIAAGYKKFCDLEMAFCCVLFVIIVVLVFISAILRKLDIPLSWTIDVSQLCFAWLAFFGADIALRKGSLVGVDIITMRLSPKLQRNIKLFNYVFILGFILILCKNGFPLAFKNWSRSFQTLPISYGFVTLSLPCASILMVLSVIHNVFQLFVPDNEEVEKCHCC